MIYSHKKSTNLSRSTTRALSVASGFPGGALSTPMALTSSETPFVYVYPWYFGYGARYSNPAVLPYGATPGVSFSPNGNNIAVAFTAAAFQAYASVYSWSGGFNTKYSDFTSVPTTASTAYDIKFSPSANDVAMAHSGPPYVVAYSWSSGWGTKYSNPATVPTGQGSSITFSPSGNTIAVGTTTTPYISVYQWSNGFGTKYADPATLPTGATANVAFSPNESTIAVSGSNTTPYVSVYPWSNGFGTKYADVSPITLISGNSNTVAFSPNGNDIVVARGTTGTSISALCAFPWSNGFGTKYTDPVPISYVSSTDVSFSSDGSFVTQVGRYYPFIMTYSWSSGWGTKYADPTEVPPTLTTTGIYALALGSTF